jgi:hypothetical protein
LQCFNHQDYTMSEYTYSFSSLTGGSTFRLHPRRTLIPLEVFCVLHGLKLTRAYGLVDNFSVWPAFNLATSLGGRRKIHLWRGCVEVYDPYREMPRGKLADIIAAVLPPLENPPVAAPTVRGCELTFRFCCSHNRIQDLVRAGELREFGRHHGVGQTSRITYASAVKFLESRVVGRRSTGKNENGGESAEEAGQEAHAAGEAQVLAEEQSLKS